MDREYMIPLNTTPIQSKNYGPFIIERDEGCCDVFIKFIDTGYKCKTTRRVLREEKPFIRDPLMPSVYGVGYMGVGIHGGKKGCRSLEIWRKMLSCCYSKESLLSHKNNSMCSSWHNYQNFSEWYNQHSGGKDMGLSRQGGKVYSPEACVLTVPKERVIIPNGTEFMTLHCGMAVTTKYESSARVHVTFIDTGYKTTTSAKYIMSDTPPPIRDRYAPTVFSVGYMGVGPHKSKHNGKINRTYDIWTSMLYRCYGKNRRDSYEGCYVCDEWHNFQTFADWYEANGGGPGLDLDKDIKYLGNRVYSPDHCLIVTPLQNAQVKRKPQRRSK